MHLHIWIVTALFLWSSGSLVAAALRLRPADRLVALAVQMALGLSIWPILFLATTQLGIALPAGEMRGIVYGTIAAALVLTAIRLYRRPPSRWRLRPALPLLVTFAVLAALAVAVRLSHIRGLSFPPWVDGVHHGMIIRLLLEHGVVPASADPYIAGADFFYHWGFHVPAAFVAAATGSLAYSELPTFLLQYGQALNALTLLMVYAAGRTLLRSRDGGLFAAALAVFVSYYPAFYVSWGRYTHLTGTLVLPPLLIALWQLSRATRPWRWALATSILAAGLVLIHVRIALFALAFAVVMLVAARPYVLRTLLRWSAAALVTALLAAPWLLALARNPHVGDVVTPSRPGGGLPMHLIASVHNAELLAIATAGVSGMAGWLGMSTTGRIVSAVWWLLIVALSRYEPKSARARRRLPWGAYWLIGGWVLLLALTLYWRPWGLDLTAFATLDSAIITMFLPVSIAGAALIAWVVARIAPRLRDGAVFAIALALSIAGATTVTTVVNPQTVFTNASDLRALQWIEANVPRNAVFAVDARPWMAPAWVGIDGGYWLHVATGRRSILPPLLYGWSLPRERVSAVNGLLSVWSDPNSQPWGALRAAGVTHIYIGPSGRQEKRRALLASNRVRAVFQDGGAVVFQIQ